MKQPPDFILDDIFCFWFKERKFKCGNMRRIKFTIQNNKIMLDWGNQEVLYNNGGDAHQEVLCVYKKWLISNELKKKLGEK